MTKKKTKQQDKGYKWFVAGGVAGTVEASLTCPLDVIKTRMANKRGLYSGPFNGLYTAARNEGIRALWSGFLPFWTQLAMKSSIRFTTYEMCRRFVASLLPGEGPVYEAQLTALAGACGGSVEALVWTTPLERLKILKMTGAVPKSVNSLRALGIIFKDQGLLGSASYLYRGANWTVLRQASSAMTNFSVFNKLMSVLGYDGQLAPVYVTALAGMVSGSCSVCFNQPIDVLKTRVQSSAGSARKSVRQAVQQVLADGPLAFYSGMSARLLRMGMGQACVFTGYGYVRVFLDKAFDK